MFYTFLFRVTLKRARDNLRFYIADWGSLYSCIHYQLEEGPFPFSLPRRSSVGPRRLHSAAVLGPVVHVELSARTPSRAFGDG